VRETDTQREFGGGERHRERECVRDYKDFEKDIEREEERGKQKWTIRIETLEEMQSFQSH